MTVKTMAGNNPHGRPTKFKPKFVEMAAAMWSAGATTREVAKKLRVTETTLYQWLRDDPQFQQAKEKATSVVDDLVEAALFKQATGQFTQPDVHIAVNAQGEVTKVPYTKHLAPNITAGIFWLKNRRPAQWRERIEVRSPVDMRALCATTIDAELVQDGPTSAAQGQIGPAPEVPADQTDPGQSQG
jgi:phage antirepressor YoqD-like protein